jgi:hypothetical protein
MHNCSRKKTSFRKIVPNSYTAALMAFLEFRKSKPLALSNPSYIQPNTALW